MAERRTGQQRGRDAQQRPHRASVRMNAEEYEQIAARAAAAKMTVPSFLVSAGLDLDMSRRGRDSRQDGPAPRMSSAFQRSLGAELLGLGRNVRKACSNLNQLTRYAHTERHRPDELPETLRELRALAEQLSTVSEEIRPMARRTTARRPRAAEIEAEAAAAAEQYGIDEEL